ncbi:hypothetical protein LSCM4_04901 [Leishmania orientalis]|uniref:Guanine nucleotide-binding protein-like protein n=1 Tax=Leishmania orientalis TaxID=2249476 RepID=A0A836HWB4_9TRYP|nr:hypothetical protein LSCM4_04901 [Leishmania orientalis]
MLECTDSCGSQDTMDKQDAAHEVDHLREIECLAAVHLTSTTDASSSSLATTSHAAASLIMSVVDPSPSSSSHAAAPSARTYAASPRPLSTSISSDTCTSAGGALLVPAAVGQHSGYLRTYKVLIVGEAGVGKSNLMQRYCYNQYDPTLPSTIGVEFCSREVKIPFGPVGATETVVLQLWDTAGQERNAGVISNAFYRNAVGAIIVYDVTRHESLLNVPRWAARVTELARDDCVCIVVGAKLDLLDADKVTASSTTTSGSLEALQQEADRISHAMGMRNFMTSALSGKGVLEAFAHLVLAVDAVQAAPLHKSGTLCGTYLAGHSGHAGGDPVQNSRMQTAAASVSASPMDGMGGADGPHCQLGIDEDVASLSQPRAASTQVMSGHTGASHAASWGQPQPPWVAKKTLDLRGFGPTLAEPGASAASPACSGARGC